MRFYNIFRDELLSHSNIVNTFLTNKPDAHPSSPINVKHIFKGNGQVGASFLLECYVIPSPPSMVAPLDITMVDRGNEIASIIFRSPDTSDKSDIIYNNDFFLPLSTIFYSLFYIPPISNNNNTYNYVGV